MANKEEKPEGNWLCNTQTGEFLGRTACSWAQIFLFYLVFYGFLAGFFSLTMWVSLQMLDENVPKYSDRVANPGLVIRPKSLDISYNRSDSKTYGDYVKHLDTLLTGYNDKVQEANALCLVGQYTDQSAEAEKKVCQFRRSLLRQCDGLSDPSFGYAEGQPCVLLKLNRVVGLMPRGDPYISCEVKGEGSLNMQYFPAEGRIDKMYFPYYGKKAQPNYVQPLVAVKLLLTDKDYNKELAVECKVEGSNLKNNDDRDKFQGRVLFRVKVVA